jgi:hypothetical protein
VIQGKKAIYEQMVALTEIINAILRLHYITAEDVYDTDNTVDICAECGNDYPCTTVTLAIGEDA